MIIGPFTPPCSFILHPEILNLLTEIGIVLLLFVVGRVPDSKTPVGWKEGDGDCLLQGPWNFWALIRRG